MFSPLYIHIFRLTHPAARGQRQILELAAYQLVYHIPMPNLLLESNEGPKVHLEAHPRSTTGQAPSNGETGFQDRRKKPLLPLLLSEGIYEVIITALSAWVLVSAHSYATLSLRIKAQSRIA